MTPGIRAMQRARVMRAIEKRTRANIQRLGITIEYEDDNYQYISSEYPFPELKQDIEGIKRPITILYKRSQRR